MENIHFLYKINSKNLLQQLLATRDIYVQNIQSQNKQDQTEGSLQADYDRVSCAIHDDEMPSKATYCYQMDRSKSLASLFHSHYFTNDFF